MRRLLHRHLVAAGAFVAVGGLLSGCADNESVLFIAGVIWREPPDCTASSDPTGTMLMSGRVDEALTDSYEAALLVGNQITRQGSRDKLRTETSRVSILGAEVHVLTTAGKERDAFTVPAQGQIDPGTGQLPGYGVVYAQLLSSVSELGVGQVTAKVQVYGETLGGQEVESNWLRFPIEILNGDLIRFPAGVGVGDSCDFAEGDDQATCFKGQDGLTSCGLCQDVPACVTRGG